MAEIILSERELRRRARLCFECESEDCAYNEYGVCRFSLVAGTPCKITEEHGCHDFVVQN